MPKTLALMVALVLAAPALAERVTEVNGRHVQLYPSKGRAAGHGLRQKSNLSYHNGPVIHAARVVSIFWGAEWGTETNPSQVAQHIMSFFGQFGTNSQYKVITQYYDASGSIQLTNLTATHWFDPSPPPTSVTDLDVRNEVIKALTSSSVGLDRDTVYEVFLPSTSYATYGSWNSCGGPNLQFCAYHSNFSYAGLDLKFSSMPYPSCGGCQWPGWTVAQNIDHFACHETREAVTDPDGTAWYDRQGSEADDKCSWSPSPFLVNGFGYQYEWSNLKSGCVQSQP